MYFNLLSCVMETRLSFLKPECGAGISEFTYIHTCTRMSESNTSLFYFGSLCLHFRFPNVIILTTSNVTGAIDLAFVDRYVEVR